MINVIDNFLNKDDFKKIESVIISDDFPWFYKKSKVYKGDNISNFKHIFYGGNFVNSSFFDILNPITEKCNMRFLIKIAANFDYKKNNSFKTNLHTDMEPPLEKFKTGIFYLNSNNGKTIFENGEVIDSVANRFIEFPQNMLHCTQTHTDTDYRIIINFNWYDMAK